MSNRLIAIRTIIIPDNITDQVDRDKWVNVQIARQPKQGDYPRRVAFGHLVFDESNPNKIIEVYAAEPKMGFPEDLPEEILERSLTAAAVQEEKNPNGNNEKKARGEVARTRR